METGIKMKGLRYIVIFLACAPLLFTACSEKEVLPNPSELPNAQPYKFDIRVLDISYDRATIEWGPVYDVDKDDLYHSVYLNDQEIVKNSTVDSIVTFHNLKPQTSYSGKVVVTDLKNTPIEIPFSLTTTKYRLTFTRKYLGENGNYPVGYSMVRTRDGGYAVAAASAFENVTGIYMSKLDSLGFEQWHYVYNAYKRDQNSTRQIVQTSDGGYIIAAHETIIKLDKNGSKIWQVIDNSQEFYYYAYRYSSVIETDDHEFLALGTTQKSSTSINFIVTKLNVAGSVIWTKEYHTNEINYGKRICKAADGNYAILGTDRSETSSQVAVLKINPQGEVLWSKTFGNKGYYFASDIKSTSDNGFVVATNYMDGRLSMHATVMKLSGEGFLQWEKEYQIGSYGTSVFSITEIKGGGFAFAGSAEFLSNTSGLVVQLNSSGEMVWKKEYYPNYSDYQWRCTEIMQNNDGGYSVVGNKSYVWSPVGKDIGMWVMKIDDLGNF
jgi:hypothetical protein